MSGIDFAHKRQVTPRFYLPTPEFEHASQPSPISESLWKCRNLLIPTLPIELSLKLYGQSHIVFNCILNRVGNDPAVFLNIHLQRTHPKELPRIKAERGVGAQLMGSSKLGITGRFPVVPV